MTNTLNRYFPPSTAELGLRYHFADWCKHLLADTDLPRMKFDTFIEAREKPIDWLPNPEATHKMFERYSDQDLGVPWYKVADGPFALPKITPDGDYFPAIVDRYELDEVGQIPMIYSRKSKSIYEIIAHVINEGKSVGVMCKTEDDAKALFNSSSNLLAKMQAEIHKP